MSDPIALSVRDACATLGIKRTLLFACLNDGRLTRRKVGRRTLVTMASIRQLLGEATAR